MVAAPIIVTVYDRLQHFQQCIDALLRNGSACASELYVVSDAPGKPGHEERIARVREYAKSIVGFQKVRLVFREENYGGHRSFIAITQQVLSEHGRFIFLEDDVVVSHNFLDYMNEGLDFYEEERRIFSIAAYTLPFRMPKDFSSDVFCLPSNCPWGFATWKDRWDGLDFSVKDRYGMALRDRALYNKIRSTGNYMLQILRADSIGELQTPDVRVAFHQFVHDLYTVYPRFSKAMNIGLDGSGQHSGRDTGNKYHAQLDTATKKMVFDASVRLNPAILESVRKFQNGSVAHRLVSNLRIVKNRWFNKLRLGG